MEDKKGLHPETDKKGLHPETDTNDLYPEIERILPLVQYPQRYIGNEIGAVKKKNFKNKIVFGFPDLYELGMSNLALKIFYDIFYDDPDIAFERTFLPAGDMLELMRTNGIPLFTLESFSPVKEADLLAFTLPSELLLINALRMMKAALIPLFSTERDKGGYPILVAGGPGTVNPLPLFPFFDVIFIGEAEEAFPRMAALLKEHRNREDLLHILSRLDGFIITSIYKKTSFGEFLIAEGPLKDYVRWEKFHDTPPAAERLIPITQIGEKRREIEIMRGCSAMCRFCLAGSLYRPRRERDVNTVLQDIIAGIEKNASDSISLLSLSSGDYSGINDLINELLKLKDDIRISLPSLRIDSIDTELLTALGSRKITNLTFALETGSERLRKAINKKITDAEYFGMLDKIRDKSWRTVKLYFMLGLPGETDDDIKSTAGLIERTVYILGKRFSINISISVFVPKPHTPFETSDLISPEDFKRRISFFHFLRKYKNVKINYGDRETAALETMASRGDIRAGMFLAELAEKGLDHDALFANREIITEAAGKAGMDKFLYSFDTPYWRDIVSISDGDFLRREREAGEKCEETQDCFEGTCLACGACGGREPGYRKSAPITVSVKPQHTDTAEDRLYLLKFEKRGISKFLSHNDLNYVVCRLLEMSGMHLVKRTGFARNAKISFFHALQLGIESLAEYAACHLKEKVGEERVRAFNNRAPQGLRLTEAKEIESLPRIASVEFTAFYSDGRAEKFVLVRKEGNIESLPAYLDALPEKPLKVIKTGSFFE